MHPPNTRALLLSIGILISICVGAWILNTIHFTQTTSQTSQEAETIAHLCANLEYSDEDIPLPITCVLPIHNDETAEFTFQADGGLLVQRGNETLLKLTYDTGVGGTHFSQLAYLNQPTLRPDGFILQDITFDGYADLQVMTFAGAYNFAYDFYTYNPQTRTFGPEPILKDVVNPGVDTERKEITYFHKGRGLADMFSSGTYEFRDGAYVLTHTVEQDMVSEYDNPNPLYERITSKLQNGEMVVVKKETLTAKEVWGE